VRAIWETAAMNGGHPDDDWQPATSAPGELFTPEGQIRAARSFWRGMRRNDPGTRRYRRSMYGPALVFIGIGIAFVVIASVLQAVF
jgi:hypothetical protein